MLETTRDTLLEGRVVLLQPARGHRAGTDAVLLAAAAPLRPGDRVADLGAATGAVGLMLAARDATCHVTLVERDPALAALAQTNLALNGWADRGRALVADLLADKRARRAAGLLPGCVDLVVTNPPFLERTAAVRTSPEAGRREAHTLPAGGLAGWMEAAAHLLAPRGRLAIVHRADHLAPCLAALAPAFGSFSLRMVHPGPGAAAKRILVTAVRGGRAPTIVEPPLFLDEGDDFASLVRRLETDAGRPSARGRRREKGAPAEPERPFHRQRR